jgi:hypothetical protein
MTGPANAIPMPGPVLGPVCVQKCLTRFRLGVRKGTSFSREAAAHCPTDRQPVRGIGLEENRVKSEFTGCIDGISWETNQSILMRMSQPVALHQTSIF